jgi:hypothetical protein
VIEPVNDGVSWERRLRTPIPNRPSALRIVQSTMMAAPRAAHKQAAAAPDARINGMCRPGEMLPGYVAQYRGYPWT